MRTRRASPTTALKNVDPWEAPLLDGDLDRLGGLFFDEPPGLFGDALLTGPFF
jgi:hypothetical protein